MSKQLLVAVILEIFAVKYRVCNCLYWKTIESNMLKEEGAAMTQTSTTMTRSEPKLPLKVV